MGCPSSTSEKIVACLRQLPARVLNDAQTKVQHSETYAIGKKSKSFHSDKAVRKLKKIIYSESLWKRNWTIFGGGKLLSMTSSSELWILTVWFSFRLNSFYTALIMSSKINLNIVFCVPSVASCLPLGVTLEESQISVALITEFMQTTKQSGMSVFCIWGGRRWKLRYK